MVLRTSAVVWAVLALAGVGAPGAPARQVNPFPRQTVTVRKLHEWTFDDRAGGWSAEGDCELGTAPGVLKIKSTGPDPNLVASCRVKATPPGLVVHLRLRCATGGAGQFFWTTPKGSWSPRRSKYFELIHDGKWHEYTVTLPVAGTMTGLRLDPGSAPGTAEVDWIRVHEGGLHPLEIVRLESSVGTVKVHVKNHGPGRREISCGGQVRVVEAGRTVAVAVKAPGKRPFEARTVAVASKGLPALRRTVVLYRPDVKCDWVVLKSGDLTVSAAGDGSGVKIALGPKPVAVLAPLVMRDGGIAQLKLRKSSAGAVEFQGPNVTVRLALRGSDINVRIDAKGPVEGPVVRVFGRLEQGLLAGLEYLGKGERSSSKLDIETADHLRFAPDPMKVTMPLTAFATDRATVAMTWKDMTLRPTYATPNFIDGAADHRTSLRGRKIDATIRVFRTGRGLEGPIRWAVERMGGFPAVPKAPRSRADQWKLATDCINGPLAGAGGWGHCVEKRWARRPHADIASTLWRITGKAPELGRIVPGGSHVPNEAIYFATGRADEWLRVRGAEARRFAAAQGADGAFRYSGKYRRGHFEDTASGHCAYRARRLLEFAHVTGDKAALAAGVKTLEYMKRFRTPRGAQTWELSLHTPDILASANLVWAYTRGYELTGRGEYLSLARKWAASGVPFVYLWGGRPIMKYATVPVYGATNWRGPLWIGLPVQWCGGVYAYALVMLAPHDDTMDWRRLARGILVAAEQMQYPSGRLAGCLPDIFNLAGQRRAGPSINPCALVSLRLVLDGRLDALAVAADGKHRIASPFPVKIRSPKAYVTAAKGVRYQVLIDGKRIVSITSKGTDEVALE